MKQANKGDTVAFTYEGTLANGEVFDSSAGRDPLEFVLGSGQIIAGLDAAIQGMTVGESKTVEVPCDLAYGPRHPDAQQTIPRSEIPEDIPLDIGTALQMQTPQGQMVPISIVAVTDDEVTVDANHALAGEDLTFAIEIVKIGTP